MVSVTFSSLIKYQLFVSGDYSINGDVLRKQLELGWQRGCLLPTDIVWGTQSLKLHGFEAFGKLTTCLAVVLLDGHILNVIIQDTKPATTGFSRKLQISRP